MQQVLMWNLRWTWPRAALAWAIAILASAGWCALHGVVSGRSTVGSGLALSWAVATWTGWLLVLPLLQRAFRPDWRSWPAIRDGLTWLSPALLGAVALEWLLRQLLAPAGVEALPPQAVAYRHAPAVLALASLLVCLRRAQAPVREAHEATATAIDRARTDAVDAARVETAAPLACGADAGEAVLRASRGRTPVEVPVRAITHVTAEENYVALHGLGGVPPLVRCTLRQLARQLAAHDFVQVHRSVLVRRDAIVAHEPRGRLRLADGTCVPVGRRFRAALQSPRRSPPA